MAVRDFRHALEDMLGAIKGIQQATAEKTLADFETEWLLRHGVERGIEIVSEASRSLPEAIKALRPEIPWKNIHGIGNVLRHDYHGLSARILWGVVVDELPRLKAALIAIADCTSDPSP